LLLFEDAYAVTPGHLLFVPQYNTDALIHEAFEQAMTEGRKNGIAWTMPWIQYWYQY